MCARKIDHVNIAWWYHNTTMSTLISTEIFGLVNLPPELILEIFRYLDLNSILSLCRTCRSCYDQFWFTQNDCLWKFLYHRDISVREPPGLYQWTDRFNLPFGEPYELTYGRSYQLVRHDIMDKTNGHSCDNYHNIKLILNWATENGYERLALRLIRASQIDFFCSSIFYEAILHASKAGMIEVVREMLTRDPNLVWNDWAVEFAAEQGHWDIVFEFLNRGSRYIQSVLRCAAQGGHLHLVNELMQRGAQPTASVLSVAAQYGRFDIVKQFSNFMREPSDFDYAIYDAQRNHHTEIAQYLDQRRKDLRCQLSGDS